MAKDRMIAYQLRQVDLLRASADVVALKYAQRYHGVDRAVAEALQAKGKPTKAFELAVGAHAIRPSDGAIRADRVLFLGVPELGDFRYREIRRFSARVLTTLARETPDVRTVAMTLHGAGYGLDIVESALQQCLGVKDAIDAGSYPEALEAVVIAEVVPYRLEAAADAIEKALKDAARPGGWKPATRMEWPIYPVPEPSAARKKGRQVISATVNKITGQPSPKKRVFVAMPFDPKMRDIWRFGIHDPVWNAGLLCERIDEKVFAGSIMSRVLQSIESADLVLADLTGGNPNVFLEVGYAWGCKRPTLFLCRRDKEGKGPSLPFDVKDHKCVFYTDATELAESVPALLRGLGLIED